MDINGELLGDGRFGFKLLANCVCYGTEAINNPSNLFQAHRPDLLPSTLRGTFPFIQPCGPCSEQLGNSQKALKQNDLHDCKFFNFSFEKL